VRDFASQVASAVDVETALWTTGERRARDRAPRSRPRTGVAGSTDAFLIALTPLDARHRSR
jgi:hypothetical protein